MQSLCDPTGISGDIPRGNLEWNDGHECKFRGNRANQGARQGSSQVLVIYKSMSNKRSSNMVPTEYIPLHVNWGKAVGRLSTNNLT